MKRRSKMDMVSPCIKVCLIIFVFIFAVAGTIKFYLNKEDKKFLENAGIKFEKSGEEE
jgi:hypothetical protein